jgi:hypothetical protein
MKVFEKASDVPWGNWFRLVKNRTLIFERLFGDRLRIGTKEFLVVIALSGSLWGKVVFIPADQEVESLENFLPNIRDC